MIFFRKFILFFVANHTPQLKMSAWRNHFFIPAGAGTGMQQYA